MQPDNRSGPGQGSGPAETSGREGYRHGTRPAPCQRCGTLDVERAVAELEGVIAAARHGWEWVLEDTYGTPAWRLAWLLLGMPTPLPRAQYREVLAAVEARYGVAAVIDGLRKAAACPIPHGADVRADDLDSLARKYERAGRRSA